MFSSNTYNLRGWFEVDIVIVVWDCTVSSSKVPTCQEHALAQQTDCDTIRQSLGVSHLFKSEVKNMPMHRSRPINR